MAFEKSTKKIQTMSALEDMRKSLQSLGPIPNDIGIYDYAVHFFNIVAMFQDKYSLQDLSGKNPVAGMDDLAAHMANAGRDKYGWVRAKKGEPVTLNNLYLGNFAGIWTAPAAEFKEKADDKYIQDNIQRQLRVFIKSHREPMIELSGKVLKNVKNPNGSILFRMFGNKKAMEK